MNVDPKATKQSAEASVELNEADVSTDELLNLSEVDEVSEVLEHAEVSESVDNVMLTTIDNPFNPFKNFDDWYDFDESSGYHSTALLARVAISSDKLSESEQVYDYEQAIDEIVRENVSGIHRKVYKNQTK